MQWLKNDKGGKTVTGKKLNSGAKLNTFGGSPMTKSMTIAAILVLGLIAMSAFPDALAIVAGAVAVIGVIFFIGLIIEYVTEGG